MYRSQHLAALLGGVGIALALALLTGCPFATPTPTATPTVPAATSTPAPTATPTPIPAGKLTLSLDASLDGGGDIKATAISQAELLDTSGAVVKAATLLGGAAEFALNGIAAGDYFIRVNGLADDLVPTRIDDPLQDVGQRVGQKLRASVIGTSFDDATYRFKTFSKGQAEHAVVKYSDGTNATPERYAYAIVSPKSTPKKLEVRDLGTAALLTSYSPPLDTHPTAGGPSFYSWIIGGNNHGKDANYGGDDTKCNICHGDLDAKAAQHADITTSNGWCFRCHYGKGGDPNGMVDPAQ